MSGKFSFNVSNVSNGKNAVNVGISTHLQISAGARDFGCADKQIFFFRSQSDVWIENVLTLKVGANKSSVPIFSKVKHTEFNENTILIDVSADLLCLC